MTMLRKFGRPLRLRQCIQELHRKTCMQYYKLDLCHYFTSPCLSWDAMLKMTNIKLELMTDIDMFQFIEKGCVVEYLTSQIGMERPTST